MGFEKKIKQESIREIISLIDTFKWGQFALALLVIMLQISVIIISTTITDDASGDVSFYCLSYVCLNRYASTTTHSSIVLCIVTIAIACCGFCCCSCYPGLVSGTHIHDWDLRLTRFPIDLSNSIMSIDLSLIHFHLHIYI